MRGFYTGSGSDNRSPGGSQQTGTASQTGKVETGKNVGVMFCIKSKNATVFLTMCITILDMHVMCHDAMKLSIVNWNRKYALDRKVCQSNSFNIFQLHTKVAILRSKK